MGIGARTKPTGKKKQPRTEPKERLRPVSLHLLDFGAAMKGLLAAKPPADPDKQEQEYTSDSDE